MGHAKVLVVAADPALYEPLIALFRQRQAYSVLADQADRAASAMDPDISLIVLIGSYQFCQPLQY